MTLVVKKAKNWQRRRAVVAVWSMSILTLICAPFSQAASVLAPQKTPSNVIKLSNGSQHKSVTGASSSTAKASSSPTSPVAGSTISDSIFSANCATSTPIPAGLINTTTPELRKLAEYDQVCGSGVIGTVSFFTSIPTTTAQARSYANDVIARLNEFAAKGIQPLIFLEPTTTSGGLIDMNSYNAGTYDAALDSYFATMRAGGVSDGMMGTWVPFPEGNIPVWSSVDPTVFTAAVTKTVNFQKKYFPAGKASIMLDSESYAPGAGWGEGSEVSLLPYVQNMPAGLLNSLGLQGFPWVPPATNNEATNGEPQNYLRVDFAAQAARSLNVSTIWLNTGTFSAAYVGQGSNQVTVSPARRLQLLHEVAMQATSLKAQGFQAAVHLFAQDKSLTDEATNWSYWAPGQSSISSATPVFKSFVHELQSDGIPLWLFDSTD